LSSKPDSEKKPEKGKALDAILGVMGLEAVYEDAPEKEKKEKPAKAKHLFSGSSSSSSTSQSEGEDMASNAKSQIIVIEPQKRADAQRITDYLKQGKTVVVNVEKMPDKSDIVRLWDFLVGASYALEGTTEVLNEQVIITAPRTVDIKTMESVRATEVEEEEDFEI